MKKKKNSNKFQQIEYNRSNNNKHIIVNEQ